MLYILHIKKHKTEINQSLTFHNNLRNCKALNQKEQEKNKEKANHKIKQRIKEKIIKKKDINDWIDSSYFIIE